ncbi:MAG: aspartyl/glutamyl-tRNA amidotransferase subunit B, partial [Gallionellaceae bacterium]|nr:aspartyl/glutamyl-tRNA amidotransferase subunit B [Gallionellaceae bacterium]
RAHLEEDAGKSLHEDFHGMTGIDLNRAGTPLLEIVSEPDMRSAAEAVAYAKALHALVRWIGICDGNMQEGSFRCDANVSVHKPGTPFGTRREIKNLNSFRFLEQAIIYEAQWQIEQIESGSKIHQATVLFDPDKGETRMMRSKEEAHDYRYFPDPDLLPLEISEEWKEQIRASLPELPMLRRYRFMAPDAASFVSILQQQADIDFDANLDAAARRSLDEIRRFSKEDIVRAQNTYGLSSYDATALTADKVTADYFEQAVQIIGNENAKLAANWLIGEVSAQLNRDGLDMTQCPITPQQLGGMLKRIADNTISNSGAKEVFRSMWAEGGEADAIIEAKGLKQVSDSGAIEKIVDEIIAANADKVVEYRSGKDKLFGFFVGLAMKASKGKANPAQLNEILKKKLAG